MYPEKQIELIKLLDGSVELKNGEITIIDDSKLRGSIEKLVKKAVLSKDEVEKYRCPLPGPSHRCRSWRAS